MNVEGSFVNKKRNNFHIEILIKKIKMKNNIFFVNSVDSFNLVFFSVCVGSSIRLKNIFTLTYQYNCYFYKC